MGGSSAAHASRSRVQEEAEERRERERAPRTPPGAGPGGAAPSERDGDDFVFPPQISRTSSRPRDAEPRRRAAGRRELEEPRRGHAELQKEHGLVALERVRLEEVRDEARALQVPAHAPHVARGRRRRHDGHVVGHALRRRVHGPLLVLHLRRKRPGGGERVLEVRQAVARRAGIRLRHGGQVVRMDHRVMRRCPYAVLQLNMTFKVLHSFLPRHGGPCLPSRCARRLLAAGQQ